MGRVAAHVAGRLAAAFDCDQGSCGPHQLAQNVRHPSQNDDTGFAKSVSPFPSRKGKADTIWRPSMTLPRQVENEVCGSGRCHRRMLSDEDAWGLPLLIGRMRDKEAAVMAEFRP